VLTGDAAGRVEELEQKVAGLKRAGKYAEAQTAARAVLEICTRLKGGKHWQTVDAQELVQSLGRIAALPPQARAELAEAAKLDGEVHEHYQRGQYAAALSPLKRALDIRQRHLGAGHPEVVATTNNLAFFLERSGRYAEAEPLFRRALASRRRALGEAHPAVASSYDNLAVNLKARGKSDEAEPLFQKALAIRRRVLGEDHPDTARGYNNLASNLEAQGRYAEAEPLLRRALAGRRRALGEGDPEVARSYNNLAMNLNRQGRYAEAGPLCRQALAAFRRALGEDHPETALSYSNRATNLNAQGRYAEAEPLYRQGLAIHRRVLGEAHPYTAQSRNNLAVNLRARGKYAEAEPLCRQALALRRRALGEGHPATAQSYSELAANLSAQGRHAEAQPLAEKALGVHRRALGELHPETAASYGNLAASLSAQGRHAEAQPLAEKALASRRRVLGEAHPHTALSYNQLAMNLHARGRYAEAEAMWRAAAQSFEAARLGVSAVALERTTFAAERSPLPGLTACLARAAKAAEAWDILEDSLARGLLDQWSAPLAPPSRGDGRRRRQELRDKARQFNRQIAALLTAGEITEADRAKEQELQRKRNAVQAKLTRLEAALATRQVYDRSRIQAQLPADAALLAWVDLRGAPRAADPDGEHWACLLRRAGPPHWVRLPGGGPGGAWTADDDRLPERTLRAFRRGPDDPHGEAAELARRLAGQRLAPLEGHLRGGADVPAVTRLIVLPSPGMAGLPVEALTDCYTVSYAPSGTLFARLREKRQEALGRGRPPGPPRLLAVGDPAFRRPDPAESPGEGPGPAPLPGTRREVAALARLFGRADTLLGPQASARRLDELAAAGRLRDYRFLHLATHAIPDRERYLQSALLLSQDRLPDPLEQALAGREPEDGRLTAQHILESWQLDAELVTLSACQTALGRPGGGEGYLGFSQALLLAGAQSLVVSLWPVDDEATALLMVRFYQNLLGRRPGLARPLPKAPALAEAKRWLRGLSADEAERLGRGLAGAERVGAAQGPPRRAAGAARPYAHPHYWSAFILVGDPG
jgi:CHAT domain-containing protein/tetratricopeptide (TPR) repeat protein